MEESFLKTLIKSAEVEPNVGDEPWYVVSKGWWQTVLEAFEDGQTDPELEDINNMELVENTQEESSGLSTAVLRSTLSPDLDYVLVPKVTWEIMHERYGGGPAFARQVIEIMGKAQVEVFPYNFKVTYINRPEPPKVVDMEDQKLLIPTIKAYTFNFSRKATIREVKAALFEAFEIVPEETEKLSLYNYFEVVLGEALEIYIDKMNPRLTTTVEGEEATIHSTRLADNQSLLIDLKQETNEEATTSGVGLAASNTSSEELAMTLEMWLSKPTAFTRGNTGIRNLGNTCFLNSSLQCLSATLPLVEYYLLGKHLTELNKENPLGKGGELASEFARLVSSLWEGKSGSIIPKDFHWTLCSFEKRFSGHNQHDSQELLAYLLDGLHEDCNRVKVKPITSSIDISSDTDQSLIDAADKSWENYKLRNDSVIVDLFQAQMQSKLVCPDCAHCSISFDPIMYLSLPIPTDSIRTRDITFMCSRGIMNCAVQLARGSPMSAVKRKLQDLTGVGYSRILLTDIHSCKVHKRYKDTDSFDGVSDSDHLVAYELQYDVGIPMINQVIIPVYQRKFKPEWDESSQRWSNRSILFGMPFFIVVPKHITCGDLTKTIKKHLSQIMNVKVPPVSHSPLPFTLSMIKPNGTTLCKLAEHAHGSAIPTHGSDGANNTKPTPIQVHHLHLVLNAGDVLGVDWDLSITSNLIASPRLLPIQNHRDLERIHAEGKALATKNTSVQDCFSTFIKPEILCNGNTWRCPQCKAEKEATKTISIWSLPEVLVIHLKRFSDNYFSRMKLTNLVNYPLEGLDLAPYLSTRPKATVDSRLPDNTLYDLFAVSNHYGALGGGHYTASTLNFHTGKWHEFDDANVHDIDPRQAISDAAYVLFYRRRSGPQSTPSKL